MRPLKLLNALLTALVSEVPELVFDHFRLHISAWQLLRRVQTALDLQLHAIYGPWFQETESQLPFIVGYIFMTAAQGSAPKCKNIATSRMLVPAGKVVDEILASGAGVIELRMLHQFMGIEIETPDFWASTSKSTQLQPTLQSTGSDSDSFAFRLTPK